jgi:hypothetical protein
LTPDADRECSRFAPPTVLSRPFYGVTRSGGRRQGIPAIAPLSGTQLIDAFREDRPRYRPPSLSTPAWPIALNGLFTAASFRYQSSARALSAVTPTPIS